MHYITASQETESIVNLVTCQNTEIMADIDRLKNKQRACKGQITKNLNKLKEEFGKEASQDQIDDIEVLIKILNEKITYL